jgi:intracellular sulfur oxidation DsrE/DsrF family protein
VLARGQVFYRLRVDKKNRTYQEEKMNHWMKAALTVLSLMMISLPALSADGQHKLVLQISDNNPQKMNTVMNVAANVSRLYSARDEEVDIKIVAFNAGLHMLRSDTSPVTKRIANFAAGMPNVEFQACGNTRSAMAKKSGKAVPLFKFAEVVPAGVVSIIELDEKGYTVVRP